MQCRVRISKFCEAKERDPSEKRLTVALIYYSFQIDGNHLFAYVAHQWVTKLRDILV
jgi:hypothetical protein